MLASNHCLSCLLSLFSFALSQIIIEYSHFTITQIDERHFQNGLIPLPKIFRFVRKALRRQKHPLILTNHFSLIHDGSELNQNATELDFMIIETVTKLLVKYPENAFRREKPYLFCCRNTQIASFIASNQIEIEFDLKLHSSILWSRHKHHVLFMQSECVKMTVSINAQMQFLVMHHDNKMDIDGYWEPIISINLTRNDAETARLIQKFNYFHLHAVHGDYVDTITVIYNGQSHKTDTARYLCPRGDTIDVWLDKESSLMNGIIQNIVLLTT